MIDVAGYINFDNNKINFHCKDFVMKLVIEDEDLRNNFYQTYNKKKNFILKGVAIDFVQKRSIQFFIKEMHISGRFDVLSYICGRMEEDELFDTLMIESADIDSIFRFRHYFIDEIVSKENNESLYKNKIIIDEEKLTVNEKNYIMRYFVGDWITQGIMSSFRINGKLSVSLADKTIEEVYYICRIISKFIRFCIGFSTDYIPQANKLILCKGNQTISSFYTNDIVINDNTSSFTMNTTYDSLKSRINDLIGLLYNGIKNNKEDTLFLDHLNYETKRETPVERFMSQCRGFEYLYKRTESTDSYKQFYEQAKNVFEIKNNSKLAGRLLYVRETYKDLLQIMQFPATDSDLKEIFKLRNDITHGDYCYSNLQYDQTRLSYILDNFIFIMNLKLANYSMTDIEIITKSIWRLDK